MLVGKYDEERESNEWNIASSPGSLPLHLLVLRDFKI